jgi:hypothetical protein
MVKTSASSRTWGWIRPAARDESRVNHPGAAMLQFKHVDVPKG